MEFSITEYIEYAKVVRLLYSDSTISMEEAKGWLDELGCELSYLSKDKVVFSFFDGMCDTQITIKNDIIHIDSSLM
jgi:hypothetical protein